MNDPDRYSELDVELHIAISRASGTALNGGAEITLCGVTKAEQSSADFVFVWRSSLLRVR